MPIALAHHDDLAAAPVDVLQAQRGHLTRAQPQPGQQRQDRQVTPPDRGSGVARGQQHPGLLGRQVLRQPGQFPVGGSGHRAHQRGVRSPRAGAGTAAASAGRCPCAAPSPARRSRYGEHEPRDCAGGQRAQIEHIADDPGGQERAEQVGLALHRDRGQAALAGQVGRRSRPTSPPPAREPAAPRPLEPPRPPAGTPATVSTTGPSARADARQLADPRRTRPQPPSSTPSRPTHARPASDSDPPSAAGGLACDCKRIARPVQPRAEHLRKRRQRARDLDQRRISHARPSP